MNTILQKTLLGIGLITTTLMANAQSSSFSVELGLTGVPLSHSQSHILNNGQVISSVYDQIALTSHLILLNSNGTKVWAKQYQSMRIDDILALPSGNFAFVGYMYAGPSVWGVLDANGNQIWAKQYFSYEMNYDLATIDLLANGQLLFNISKYTRSITIRCSENGDMDDMDEGEDGMGNGKNPSFDSFACNDSGYVSSCKSDDRVMLVRHNANGDVMWAKNYMKSTTDYFHLKKIKELADGSFMGVGLICDTYAGLNNNGFIIKMDATGEILWAKKYIFPYNPGYFSATFRSFEVEQNYMYVSGYYTSDNLNMQNFLMKMDLNGNVISSKQMLSTQNALSIVPMPTIGTVSFEQSMYNHQMVYNNYNIESGTTVELNKISFDGTLGCNVTDFATTAIPYTGIMGTMAAAYTQTSILENTPVAITNISLTVSTSNLESTNACAAVAGVDETSLLTLAVYPNPASHALNIHGLNPDANYGVQIIDINGKVLFAQKGIEGVDFITLDITSINSGSYIVKIEDQQTHTATQLKWMKL
jgi:hypothetical protein